MSKIRISDDVTLMLCEDKPEWRLRIVRGASVDVISLTNDEMLELVKKYSELMGQTETYPYE